MLRTVRGPADGALPGALPAINEWKRLDLRSSWGWCTCNIEVGIVADRRGRNNEGT